MSGDGAIHYHKFCFSKWRGLMDFKQNRTQLLSIVLCLSFPKIMYATDMERIYSADRIRFQTFQALKDDKLEVSISLEGQPALYLGEPIKIRMRYTNLSDVELMLYKPNTKAFLIFIMNSEWEHRLKAHYIPPPPPYSPTAHSYQKSNHASDSMYFSMVPETMIIKKGGIWDGLINITNVYSATYQGKGVEVPGLYEIWTEFTESFSAYDSDLKSRRTIGDITLISNHLEIQFKGGKEMIPYLIDLPGNWGRARLKAFTGHVVPYKGIPWPKWWEQNKDSLIWNEEKFIFEPKPSSSVPAE